MRKEVETVVRKNLDDIVNRIAEQTEPQTEDKHAVCTGCDYYDLPNAFHPCASCVDFSKYKPKIEDEPPDYCKKRNCVWWSRSFRICLAERNGIVCKYKSGKE